ncbi:MAG: cupredoxin domain-containing protein [Deltaproteobacteria bacterium]
MKRARAVLFLVTALWVLAAFLRSTQAQMQEPEPASAVQESGSLSPAGPHRHEMAPESPAAEGSQGIPLSGAVEDGVRVVEVEAYRYGYSPDPIVVKKGEKVRLRLTTRDVEHGFGIKDLGIDVKVEPGRATQVDFMPKEAGEYPILCTVYCGPGHAHMHAVLRVLE